MNVSLTVDKVFAKIGDELTYTIKLQNTRDEKLSQINLLSTLPKEIEKIDELEEGINDIELLPQQSYEVFYKVRILDIPETNTLIHIIDLTYQDDKGEKYSAVSNTVLTVVNDPKINLEHGGIQLSSERELIDRQEEVSYKIVLKNQGNVAAEKIYIRQLVPAYMVLSSKEIVGGEIEVGGLNIGETKQFTYKARLSELPDEYSIANQVEVVYEFVLPDRTRVHRSFLSNLVETKIETAYFAEGKEGIEYRVSKTTAKIGERLYYTLMLWNKGNKTAEKVKLTDLVPKGINDWEGILKINDTEEVIEGEELVIDKIGPGEKVHIQWEIAIGEMIPPINPLCSQIGICYYYETGKSKVLGSQWIQETKTLVTAAILKADRGGIRLSADKQVATVGDVIEYKILLHNSGNQSAKNVQLGMRWIDGVMVISEEWMNKGEGLYKQLEREILPGEFYTEAVYFIVEELNAKAQVVQSCQIEYSYQVGKEQILEKSDWIQEVTTYLYEARLIPKEGKEKKVDKEYGQIGDILTYSMTIHNVGNQIAETIYWKESVPEQLEIIEGSIQINGETIWQEIREGIYLGGLQENQDLELIYQAKIKSIPEAGTIQPSTKISYTYEVGESQPKEKEMYLQGEETNIEMACFGEEGFDKTVSQKVVAIGDTLYYATRIKNTGNATAYNIRVQESGAVEKETVIQQLGAGETKEINYEVQVQGLNKEEVITSKTQLYYQYLLGEVWQSGYECLEELVTEIKDTNIFVETSGMIQTVSKQWAKVGDLLTYHLTINNPGNVEATKIRLNIAIPKEVKWLEESVQINGQSQKVGPLIEGINLSAGESLEIIYTTQVLAIPQNNIIEVRPTLDYEFEVETGRIVERTCIGESSETTIHYAEMVRNKEMGGSRLIPDILAVDEEGTYEIEWINEGNRIISEIEINEKLSPGLEYVAGSLSINGMPSEMDQVESIKIEVLMPGEGLKIRFKVKAIAYKEEELFIGESLYYQYSCNPEKMPELVHYEMPRQKVLIGDPYIVAERGGIVIETDKQYVDRGEEINYKIKVRNTGNRKAEEVNCRIIAAEEIEIDTQWTKKGIWFGAIGVGESKEAEFKGKIEKLPESEKVILTAQVSYRFEKNKEQMLKREVNCESPITFIQTAGPLKSENLLVKLSKDVVSYDEEMIIIWKIINEGNSLMEEVSLKCQEGDSWPLICENLMIEGEEVEGGNWEEGLIIGNIEAFSSKEVKVKARVRYIPKKSKCNLQGLLTYTYRVDPQKIKRIKEVLTPPAYFEIQDASLRSPGSLMLQPDRHRMRLEEKCIWKFKLQNTGNKDAYLIKIRPSLSEQLNLNDAGCYLESGKVLTGDSTNGWLLEKMEVGQEEILCLEVLAKAIGEQKPWMQMHMTYEILCQNDEKRKFEWLTQKEQIDLKSVDFREEHFSKKVSQQIVMLGEVIEYEMRLKNAGNIPAMDVRIHQDTKGYAEIVGGSIRVNGESYQSVFTEEGLQLGVIKPEEDVVVTFQAKAIRLTEEKYEDWSFITHQLEDGSIEQIGEYMTPIVVQSPVIEVLLQPQTKSMIVGDEVEYRLEIKNEGNLAAEEIRLTHLLPEGICFIPKSLKIGEQNIFGMHELNELQINHLAPKEQMTYTFKTYVAERKSKKIKLSPHIDYEFGIRKQKSKVNKEVNGLIVAIEEAELEMQVKATKEHLKEGEEQNIFAHLTNQGSLMIKQMMFYTELAPGLELVKGSLKVGEKNIGIVHLQEGINLGALEVGESINLVYRVKVKEYYKTQLENTLRVTYVFEDGEKTRSKQSVSRHHMKVVAPSLVQIKHENKIILPYQMKDIKEIQKVEVSAKLIQIQPSAMSDQKVMIKGIVSYEITYWSMQQETEKIRGEKLFIKEEEILRQIALESSPELVIGVNQYAYGIVSTREMVLWVEMSIREA